MMLLKRLGAGVLALVFVAGCSGGGSSGTADNGGGGKSGPVAQDVVIANVTDIVQFDPLDIQDAPSSLVAGQVMEQLVDRDKDGKAKPGLAERWTTSPDGLTWTFELRKNVKFHDGSDFNADVVKWHYDRVLYDKAAPARFRKQWSDIIKEVKVVDPYKVDILLKAPNAAFLDLVVTTNGGFIWSKASFEKLGAKQAALQPVGTGPFKFKEWVPGQKVILEANKDYWGEKSKLNTLVFRPIPESNTQVIELETGGAHLITKLGQEDVTRLKQNKEVKVETVPAYRVRFLEINASRPPFTDLKVRQAINYALDTKAMVTSLLGDLATPSESALMPVASWAHPQAGATTAYKPDPNRARALLAEAGWQLEGGKLMKDGKPFKFTLYSPNGRYFMDKEIAEVVKNQLTQLGMQVDLKVMEWAPYTDLTAKGDFDICFLGWNQSTNEPSIFLDPLVKTGGRGNYAKFSDKELDGWLDAAVATTDQAKRLELYGKAVNRVAENAWYVPLYNESKVAATRVELKGYTHTAAGDSYDTLYLGGKDQ
ncbi:MAG: peptide/nickel transport system substrate-binding protein [Firmicutes bacterium]|nr:peptide/nickel transport system substrate-binding protein [Bacillota bacterium]